MSEAAGLLVRAAEKRREAARVRDIAATLSDDGQIASLARYAQECEDQAILLERQAAELRALVTHSKRLAEEIQDLADEARRQLAELQRQLKGKP